MHSVYGLHDLAVGRRIDRQVLLHFELSPPLILIEFGKVSNVEHITMRKLTPVTLTLICTFVLTACGGSNEISGPGNSGTLQGLIQSDDSSPDTDGDGRSDNEEGSGCLLYTSPSPRDRG